MISTIEVRDSILYEIVEDYRSQSAIYIVINKKLIADIANQSKTLHAIISIDASNYFNSIAYSISSLIYHHFGLPESYISTFFITIQNMQIYLVTACSISNTFYTEIKENPFQELIQENEAASLGFLLIAVILIRRLYQAELIPPSYSPIYKVIYHLAS